MLGCCHSVSLSLSRLTHGEANENERRGDWRMRMTSRRGGDCTGDWRLATGDNAQRRLPGWARRRRNRREGWRESDRNRIRRFDSHVSFFVVRWNARQIQNSSTSHEHAARRAAPAMATRIEYELRRAAPRLFECRLLASALIFSLLDRARCKSV